MKKIKSKEHNTFENKILVIEDDRSILDAIRMVLEYTGYSVEIAGNGDTALKDLLNGSNGLPRLIILDILLSGKDGRDICRILKQTKATKHIPIIMMSAHPNAETSAFESGADDFTAKPFEIDDLILKIKKHLKE
jgi:DNA-binding response OmpR family regulator